MNTGQICAMVAGVEMDAAVAEALGYTFFKTFLIEDDKESIIVRTDGGGARVWRPSTDWSAAADVWRALPRLASNTEPFMWHHTRYNDEDHIIGWSNGNLIVGAHGDDFPTAVCRVFLLAQAMEASGE
jgi:hypothetical protein